MVDLPDASAATPGSTRITWTYALSHADLQRLVPRLVAPWPCTRASNEIRIDCPDERALRIELGPETERRVGSLRLRDTRFTFVFEGWSDAAVRAFLVHCTRGLQQGGG